MASCAIVIEEQLRIPGGINSLTKFRRWAREEEFPERGISFIDGEIEVDLSPEEAGHNLAKAEIQRVLSNAVLEKDLGVMHVDGILLTNVTANLSTTPDAAFLSYESIESGRVKYVESSRGSERYIEVVGTPDMVLEVVSLTSVRKDTVLLRERYWKAGVPEYWLADLLGEKTEFQILFRNGKKGWASKSEAGGWQVSKVFSRKFRLLRERNRVGRLRYRLEVAAL